MKNQRVTLGLFVLAAILLFTLALFLIGDRQSAFGSHLNLFTELANVNGLMAGSKVRVDGFEAGKVAEIQLPDRPSGKFRLKLSVAEKLHRQIRQDSLVTVESDGLVGDKFILISGGNDAREEAANGSTLPSKAPFDMSAALEKVGGVIDHADATIADLRGTLGDVHGKVDGALDSLTATVNNTNGIVAGIRQGKGTIGMLLNDQAAAGDVKTAINSAKQAVANTQQATANLNQVSVQAKQVVTDFQSRNLFAQAQDTLNNAKSATQQLDQTTQKLNQTLDEALGPDQSGENAAANIRETLSNVNLATGNLADDTEALKHGFLFRGFFKRRGYYSLDDLTPDQYRSDAHLQSGNNKRSWLDAAAFSRDSQGNESLSVAGQTAIDQIIGAAKDSVQNQPIIIEGYSSKPLPVDQMAGSRAHTVLVARYVEKKFRLKAKNIGLVALNSTPPAASGKNLWDGACIVLLSTAKGKGI